MKTFVVEVNGLEHYGEIEQAFLSDRHNFNVEIISFGLPDENFSGSTPASWTSFTADELSVVQSLIVQLARAVLGFEHRPSALDEFTDSRFMGKVVFRNGWALQKSR